MEFRQGFLCFLFIFGVSNAEAGNSKLEKSKSEMPKFAPSTSLKVYPTSLISRAYHVGSEFHFSSKFSMGPELSYDFEPSYCKFESDQSMCRDYFVGLNSHIFPWGRRRVARPFAEMGSYLFHSRRDSPEKMTEDFITPAKVVENDFIYPTLGAGVQFQYNSGFLMEVGLGYGWLLGGSGDQDETSPYHTGRGRFRIRCSVGWSF